MRNWRKDWRRCLLSSPPPAREMPRTTALILPGSAFLPASLTCLPFIAFPSLSSVPGRAARRGLSAGWAWVCTAVTTARNLRKRQSSFAIRSSMRAAAGIAEQHAALFGDRTWRPGSGNLPARELPLTRASRFSILKEMLHIGLRAKAGVEHGKLSKPREPGRVPDSRAAAALRCGRNEADPRFSWRHLRASPSRAIETDFVANCLKNQEVAARRCGGGFETANNAVRRPCPARGGNDRLKADLKRLEETLSKRRARTPSD